MKNILRFVLTLGFAVVAAFAIAAPPQTVNYQGDLTNQSGTPINTSVSMTFRLYNVAAGGAALYTEVQPAVAVSNGSFNAVIGAVTPITLPFDVPYWLSVQINADAEMAPRQPLASSPYAFRAFTADSVASVTGSQISGSITTATIPVANVIGAVAGPPGPIGATGPQGATGATGPQGSTGVTGATGPAGIAGTTGATGSAGNTVLSGSGIPAAALGVNGNFYINTAANTIHGPKAAGAWPAGVALVGPQGPIGMTGAVGAAGAAGAIGAQGVQGVAGAVGAQGPIGVTGSTGPAGATGPAGPNNITGNLTMVNSTNLAGNILKGPDRFIHNSGNTNTFIGVNAGSLGTTGFANTGGGSEALQSITSGQFNTGFGVSALRTTTIGNENTAVGTDALRNNIDGIGNTALGLRAGVNLTVGNFNTALGVAAGSSLTNGSSNLYLANLGVAVESGTIRIGTGVNQTRAFISGIRSVTPAINDALPVVIDSAGQLGTMASLPAGPIGPTGPQGATGATGPQGPIGATGPNNITGNLTMVNSTSATVGNILKGGVPFLHNFGIAFNTFIGLSAGNFSMTGTANTAIGASALNTNLGGSNNTATGFNALPNNTNGQANTANGSSALASNDSGGLNTAIGHSVLSANTAGNSNTAVGVFALEVLSAGDNNIALGTQAGRQLTTGGNNVFIANQGAAVESNTMRIGSLSNQTRAFIAGIRDVTPAVAGALPVVIDSAGQLGTVASLPAGPAGPAGPQGVQGPIGLTGPAGPNSITGNLTMVDSTNTTGNIMKGLNRFIHNFGTDNTFVGVNSGNLTSAGSSNTAIGANALTGNTGTFNIAVGVSAGSNLTTGNRNIVIGGSGVAGDTNTMRLGNLGQTLSTFIYGISGVNVIGGAPVSILASGQLGTVTSSRRYKDNITDMNAASTALMQLRPVTFHYKGDQNSAGRALQYGLIAEEVNEVYPQLVVHSADGQIETVMYQHLPPMLLNEFQKQQRTITAQAARIAELEQKSARVETLERDLLNIKTMLGVK